MVKNNKICQFSSTYPPLKDGVGDFVAKLHRLFLENNFKSVVLTSNKVSSQENIINYFHNYSLKEILKSIDLLKKRNISIIIFHYPTSIYGRKILISLIPFIYRLSGFKVILYLHEYYSYTFLGKFRILPMIWMCNNLITTDSLHAAELRKIVFGKKVNVIPGGVNFNENSIKGTQRKVIEKNKISLVYFGFIKHGKGLEELVQVFDNNSEIYTHYNLNIIGSIPENIKKEDKELLESIEISKNINYIGYLEWNLLLKELVKNDFMILPFNDGLTEKRGSFMTGAALGIPVITTKPLIPIKGLNDNNNVIYINDNRQDTISKRMKELMVVSEDEINNIGKNAKEWYFQNHSEKIVFSNIIKVTEDN